MVDRSNQVQVLQSIVHIFLKIKHVQRPIVCTYTIMVSKKVIFFQTLPKSKLLFAFVFLILGFITFLHPTIGAKVFFLFIYFQIRSVQYHCVFYFYQCSYILTNVYHFIAQLVSSLGYQQWWIYQQAKQAGAQSGRFQMPANLSENVLNKSIIIMHRENEF